MNIDEAIDAFVQTAAAVTTEYVNQHFKNLEPCVFSVEKGPKYARIVRADSGSGSVHCFVRLADGAILKAAGWKAPYIGKGGPNSPSTVRGSIYADDHGRSALTPYGVVARR